MQKDDAAIQFDGDSAVGKHGLSTDIPLDPKTFESDARMVRAAIRSGSIVSKRTLRVICERMEHTLRKKAVAIDVGEGVHIEADDSADRNAAIAGKVILDLAKLEQADRHHRDKMDLADRKLTAISAA